MMVKKGAKKKETAPLGGGNCLNAEYVPLNGGNSLNRKFKAVDLNEL